MQPLPDDERLTPPDARPIPQRARLVQAGTAILLLAILVIVPAMIERTGVGLAFTGVIIGLVIFASLVVWALLTLLQFSSRVRLVGSAVIFVIGMAGLIMAGFAGFLDPR